MSWRHRVVVLALAVQITFEGATAPSREANATDARKDFGDTSQTKKHFRGLRPMNESTRLKMRDQARDMFVHAFDRYMEHAFPRGELRPLSCSGGSFDLAKLPVVTLIDAMDTLVIVGNASEFRRIARIVTEHADFAVDTNVSVFETTIRVLGGLLSAHMLASDPKLGIFSGKCQAGDAAGAAFNSSSSGGSSSGSGGSGGSSGSRVADVQRGEEAGSADAAAGEPEECYDGGLLELAVDVGDRLLLAFNSKTGIPYGTVNLEHGVPHKESDVASLAGAGSLSLEFTTLSALTGDGRYGRAAEKAVRELFRRRSKRGLMGKHIQIHTGTWTEATAGIGANSDSFIEYLMKMYELWGDPRYLDMFVEAYVAIQRDALDGDWYQDCSVSTGAPVRQCSESLMAFWPGLQASFGDVVAASRTLNAFYAIARDNTFLPEEFDFVNWQVMRTSRLSPSYQLRPELVESTWVVYRATKDESWLWAGAEQMAALDGQCRTRCGYATVGDVASMGLMDAMPSYFLAETAKYLYLLFDEDNFVHKGDYVMTTEAHPIHIGAVRNGGFRGESSSLPPSRAAHKGSSSTHSHSHHHAHSGLHLQWLQRARELVGLALSSEAGELSDYCPCGTSSDSRSSRQRSSSSGGGSSSGSDCFGCVRPWEPSPSMRGSIGPSKTAIMQELAHRAPMDWPTSLGELEQQPETWSQYLDTLAAMHRQRMCPLFPWWDAPLPYTEDFSDRPPAGSRRPQPQSPAEEVVQQPFRWQLMEQLAGTSASFALPHIGAFQVDVARDGFRATQVQTGEVMDVRTAYHGAQLLVQSYFLDRGVDSDAEAEAEEEKSKSGSGKDKELPKRTKIAKNPAPARTLLRDLRAVMSDGEGLMTYCIVQLEGGRRHSCTPAGFTSPMDKIRPEPTSGPMVVPLDVFGCDDAALDDSDSAEEEGASSNWHAEAEPSGVQAEEHEQAQQDKQQQQKQQRQEQQQEQQQELQQQSRRAGRGRRAAPAQGAWAKGLRWVYAQVDRVMQHIKGGQVHLASTHPKAKRKWRRRSSSSSSSSSEGTLAPSLAALEPAPPPFAGKVVVALRGHCTFGHKAAVAAAGGAAALVVVNNEPGGLFLMAGPRREEGGLFEAAREAAAAMPVVLVTAEAGKEIFSAIKAQKDALAAAEDAAGADRANAAAPGSSAHSPASSDTAAGANSNDSPVDAVEKAMVTTPPPPPPPRISVDVSSIHQLLLSDAQAAADAARELFAPEKQTNSSADDGGATAEEEAAAGAQAAPAEDDDDRSGCVRRLRLAAAAKAQRKAGDQSLAPFNGEKIAAMRPPPFSEPAIGVSDDMVQALGRGRWGVGYLRKGGARAANSSSQSSGEEDEFDEGGRGEGDDGEREAEPSGGGDDAWTVLILADMEWITLDARFGTMADQPDATKC